MSSYGIVCKKPISMLPPTRAEIAHEKAMVKFMERWKKWITGFDFSVPEYRKEDLIKELLNKDLIFEEIAESYVEVKKQKRNIWQRFKNMFKLDFKKYGGWMMIGVDIEALVREDFFDSDGKPVYWQRTYCFSIAPTKELLDEREARR